MTEEQFILADVHDTGFEFGKLCAEDILNMSKPLPATTIAIYLKNGMQLLNETLTSGIIPADRVDRHSLEAAFRTAFDLGFGSEMNTKRS